MEKKECSRYMNHDRSMKNIKKHKVAKKTVKQVVYVTKGRAYKDILYQRLSTKEREKDIYRWLGFMKERQETSIK
jgi:L-amino acid N-acyltransferase YncA